MMTPSLLSVWGQHRKRRYWRGATGRPGSWTGAKSRDGPPGNLGDPALARGQGRWSGDGQREQSRPRPVVRSAWRRERSGEHEHRISRTVLSAGSFLLIDFCLTFVPFGHYDEPEILRYAITSICPKGVTPDTFYNQRGTAEQWIKEGKNAIKWTRLSCRKFDHNAVRLQLHALAYNLGNFMRTLALPDSVEQWSLTTLREKLIKIGAKIVRHGLYVIFQMAEVAIPRDLFADILRRIDRLRPTLTPA